MSAIDLIVGKVNLDVSEDDIENHLKYAIVAGKDAHVKGFADRFTIVALQDGGIH